VSRAVIHVSWATRPTLSAGEVRVVSVVARIGRFLAQAPVLSYGSMSTEPARHNSTLRLTRARSVAGQLDDWASARAWEGTDPYEGLNATRFTGRLLDSTLGRRILTQAVKRSPLDLRPLLGIASQPNAASVSWIVSAYARGGFSSPEASADKLERTVALLCSMASPGYDEPCWGYHFDYQSRVLYMPRHSPNTIASAYAGIALLDAYERTADERLLELAEGTGRFFLRHIPQTQAGDGAYFGYAPGDRSPIHNSNMHVVGFLARLSAFVDDGERFAAPARSGLEYALAHQRPDGSWPYGERENLNWTDGFHTGYVLDSLRQVADAGVEAQAAEGAWRRGLDFYRENLFLADGTPRYSAGSTYPIDCQSAAQAIQTFSIAAAHDPSFAADAWKVFDYVMAHLRRRDGLFYFQRRRLWRNRATHLRWVVAPMLLALAHLIAIDETAGVPSAVS